jgi:hypothetical protein
MVFRSMPSCTISHSGDISRNLCYNGQTFQ